MAAFSSGNTEDVHDFKKNGFPEPGYFDTTEGIEVTRKDALDILRVLEADRRAEAQRKERDEDFRRAGERAEQGKQRLFAARVQYAKMKIEPRGMTWLSFFQCHSRKDVTPYARSSCVLRS